MLKENAWKKHPDNALLKKGYLCFYVDAHAENNMRLVVDWLISLAFFLV